ncbi:hypothetical protein DL95DRAFT_407834 [Leptodontidium sp. 2 PMI_412]|nr:hypothetical protein DL95DRAFT_407834 [Leptodontidium sp. 2 PMI_412]
MPTDNNPILPDNHETSPEALSIPRFTNLGQYRREFKWKVYRKSLEPVPYVHSIACSLTDSVPNLPGLEFSCDYTDWIFPVTDNTDLIIKTRYLKPEMEIRDLQAYMRPEDHLTKYNSTFGANGNEKIEIRQKLVRGRTYKDILKFAFQFEHTKRHWPQYYGFKTTHDLIKRCAQFQARIIEKAETQMRNFCHMELLVLDSVRALASGFDEHGYIEPTALVSGANGPFFEVARYDYDTHGPHSQSMTRPEGDKLGKILKHIILSMSSQPSLASSPLSSVIYPPRMNVSILSTMKNSRKSGLSFVAFRKQMWNLSPALELRETSKTTNERLHVHFNDEVEQFVAVGVEHGDDDEDAGDIDDDDDSSSDDGLMMKRSSKPNVLNQDNQNNTQTNFSAGGSSIAILPSTMLKYRVGAPELTEPTTKILLHSQDENADVSRNLSSTFATYQESISVTHGSTQLNTLWVMNGGGECGDLHSPPGTFMCEEGDDDVVATGLID